MTLKEQLMADFKEAMKAKDEVKKNTISFARAAIKQYEVDNREELDLSLIHIFDPVGIRSGNRLYRGYLCGGKNSR